MERPRAILFDLGETLVHFAGADRLALFEAGAAAAHEYLRSLGQPLPPRERFIRSLVWRGRKAMLINRLSRRELDVDRLFRLAVGPIRRRVGRETWREMIRRMYRPLADASRVDPQAREVLVALRDAGVAVAVVSNTFVAHFAMDDHLARLGLLDLLEHRFYSERIGLKKPSLSLFRHAVRTLGVRPREAWHVGDDMTADVLGARRAGLVSVLRLPAGRRVPWWWPWRPKFVIHELAELLDLARVPRRPPGQPA